MPTEKPVINSELILEEIRRMNAPIIPEVETLAGNLGRNLSSRGVVVGSESEQTPEGQSAAAHEVAELCVRQHQLCALSASRSLPQSERLRGRRAEYACIAVSTAIERLCLSMQDSALLKEFLSLFRDRLQESLVEAE